MVFLITSASVSTPQYSPSSSPFATSADTQTPQSFKARRQALDISTTQLGGLLGISAANVELIESTPLGDEVAFLHNLTLSMLELGGLDTQDS